MPDDDSLLAQGTVDFRNEGRRHHNRRVKRLDKHGGSVYSCDMADTTTTANQTIDCYIACAHLADEPVDWAEIHDVLEFDGLTSKEASAAIIAYKEDHQS